MAIGHARPPTEPVREHHWAWGVSVISLSSHSVATVPVPLTTGHCSAATRHSPLAALRSPRTLDRRPRIGFVFLLDPAFVRPKLLYTNGQHHEQLASFWRFSITASLPLRLHRPLVTILSPLAPRPTIVGVRRRCHAPSWVQHSPPGRASTCYEMLHFTLPAEVWRAWISSQATIMDGFTTISLWTLVGRNFRLNCILKKELRRYDQRSRFPQKSPFRPFFRAFYPHPANKSALRAEGPPLSGTRETWVAANVPLATVLQPHAPRRQDRRVEAGYRPSPLATAIHRPPDWQRPNGARSRRSASLYSVCHRTGQLLRTNQSVSPRSPPPDR